MRWACDKISAAAGSLPDDALLDALQAKLRGQPGVKYAQVAAHAQARGCSAKECTGGGAFPQGVCMGGKSGKWLCLRRLHQKGGISTAAWGVRSTSGMQFPDTQQPTPSPRVRLAQEVGRRQLAALLLEHEKCAGDQVPLLLELGECSCVCFPLPAS